jgi:hypothetical protein
MQRLRIWDLKVLIHSSADNLLFIEIAVEKKQIICTALPDVLK